MANVAKWEQQRCYTNPVLHYNRQADWQKKHDFAEISIYDNFKKKIRKSNDNQNIVKLKSIKWRHVLMNFIEQQFTETP